MGGNGDAGAGVRDTGRLVAAPFLVKTYRLVDDPSTDHIVSWGEHNNSFVVWRPKDFSASLLPSYFNHTNFSSFVRQLNNYGFRKTVRGSCEFANELFRKNQKHLLSHIQRKKPCSFSPLRRRRRNIVNHSSIQLSGIPAAPSSLSEMEKEKLRSNHSLLLSEIARLENLCSRDITFFIPPSAGNPSLVDMDRKMDSVSCSSSITDVAEEMSMNPPKLFGVPLF